jgi:uncharacterized repeat protein (TIGR01451 family)
MKSFSTPKLIAIYLVIFLLFCKAESIFATKSSKIVDYVDLSLSSTSNLANLAVGSAVTYTVKLTNEGGTMATSVVVQSTLPANFTLSNSGINTATGTFSISSNQVNWNLGNIPASFSEYTITLKGIVTGEGVQTLKSEVFSLTETDVDSNPNNSSFAEDDMTFSCVSIPYRYCSGQEIEIQVSAPSGFTNYQWFKNGQAINNATGMMYTITSTGTYSFTAINPILGNTCPQELCCPIVVENNLPFTFQTNNLNPTCNQNNGSISVIGNNPYTYNINGGAFSANTIFSNLIAGTYVISAKDSKGCFSNQTINLTSSGSPAVAGVVITQPVCGQANGSLRVETIGGSGPFTYSIDGTNYVNSNIFGNLTEGSYTFYVKDNSGCVTPLLISLQNGPSGVALSGNIICDNLGNSTVTLNASGGLSPYLYSDGSGFYSSNIFTKTNGTYVFDVRDAKGCLSSITSVVNCQVACPNTVYKYCKGEPIEIRAEIQAGYTNYQWYNNGQPIPGANQQIYTISTTGVFTYSASSLEQGSSCNFVQCCPITVERYPEIVFTASLTQPDCNGSGKGAISVFASSGNQPFSYSLNSGIYQNSASFINLSQGNYTVNVKDANGCVAFLENQIIQSGTAPNAPTITADITNICGTQKATLTATGCAGTVTWTHNGSTQNPIQVGAGTYTATCTNSCGTSISSNSIQIQSGTAPNAPTITADVTNICGNQKATLTATGCAGTVTWTHNSSTQNPIQVGAGTYTATCTNSCGTSISSNSIQIQSGTAPNAPTITADITNICGTQKATLTATGCAGTVIWTHNSSTQNPIQVGAGTYTATCTNSCGTSISSNSIQIQSGTAPNAPTITTDITNICGTQKATLTATGCAGTVTWTHNSSTQNPIQVGAGTYTATCTNSCGTSISSNSIQIQSGTAPNAPTITADITNICGTQKATLTATGCAGTVTWTHNSSTQNPIQVGAGTYTATCTNSCGTSISSNSIQIQSGTAPNAPTITADITNICGTQKATLTATGCAGTVTWTHNGSTQNPIQVGAGTYTATCTNSCGTSISSNSIQIQSGIAPNAPTITADVTNICGTQKATLTATGCAGTVTWTHNSSTQNPIQVGAGTYTATCTNSCGTSISSNSIQIQSGTAPNAPTITADITNICGTQKATLTATGCSGTVTWTHNSSTQNPIQVGAGTYTATCTNSCGTSISSNSIQIQSGTAPNAPTITTDITNICGTQKATLTATGCAGTVTWTHNGSTQNPIQVGAGTYTAICTNSCGTSISSNSIQIQSGTAPNAPTITTDITNICGTQKATLTATGCAGTVTWTHNGSTQNPIQVGAGTYTATCTNSCGTSISSNSIQIQSGTAPNAPTITADITNICGTQKATLTATGCAGTVTWTHNGSTQNPIQVGAGTYTATCTNSCGTSISSNSIQIQSGTAPNAPTITADVTNVCGTQKATLTATGCAGTVTWTHNGSTQNPIQVGAGTYTATCTNSCGTSISSNSIQIQSGTAPNAPTITADITNICGTQKATLTATGCAGTVTWTHNGSTQNPIQVGAGTYTATCTNSCGTSISSNSIQIQSGTAPNAPTITADVTNICGTQKATLTATGCAGTVTWTHNGSTQNPIQVGAGTYTATCTNSCGTSISSNSIQIQSGTAPNAPTITADITNICGTQKATLTATGCAGTVTWTHNGSTQNPIQVGAGTYTATCTNSCGTSISSNSIQIQSGTAPNAPTITTDITNICGTQKATLTATGCAGTVTWTHNGSTQNPIQVGAGTYTATCTNSCGTSISSNSIQIQSGTAPNAPTITADVTNICGTQKATLTATGCAGTVTWTHNGSTQNPIQVGAGTYTATCTNSCGTSISSNSIQIQSGTAPNAPTITADVTNVCGTQKATLTATGCAGTVTWTHNGSTQNPIQVGAGTYTATCTNSCGTSISSNSIQIQSGTAPNAPTITADITNICGTQKATLTATGCAGTVTWTHNGSTQNPIQVGAGTYTATCTNSCGTSISSNSIQIQSGTAPNAPTIIEDVTNICGTQKATLTATGCAGTVTWTHNSSTQNPIQVGAGTYTATCTNSCGTSISSNSIQIQSGTAPNAPTITADVTNICGTQKATLTATGCAGTVTWTHNSSTQNPIQVGAGTYTATCTNSCGISLASNSIQISSGVLPNDLIISVNKTLCCDGEYATLTANLCNGAVTWNTGLEGSVLNISTSGTYTAFCRNACGESSKTIEIILQKVPLPTAPVITSTRNVVCSYEVVEINASQCTIGDLVWSNGATSSTINVGPGIYFAYCENICGKSGNSNTITIGMSPAPVAPVISSNKTTVCGTDKATLTATGCVGGTITWSGGGVGTTKEVGAGTYTATCTTSCGTSGNSNTITIGTSPSPVAPVISSNKTTVCGTDKATITATGCIGGTITWSGGGVGTTKEVGAGTYTATCTTSCGTSGNSNTITIGTSPSPVAPVISTNKTVVCGTDKATLTATGCADGTITWSSGLGTGTTKEVGAGTYSVTCVNSCGSSAVSNSITISNGPAPAAPVISSNKTTVCGTDKATLTATGCVGGTITWSGGGVGSTKEVGAGTYTATCTTSCGTSGNSNTITIGTSPSPVAPVISTNKTVVCGTDKATLTATGCADGTITWSSGLGTGTTKEVGVGTYTATCVNSCGSSAVSNSITISNGPAPAAPVISSNKTTVCGTDKATLTATGCVGGTITWSGGGVGTTKEVGAGTYTATCTTSCGTSGNSNTITIGTSPSPVAPVISTNKTVICGVEKATLTATGCADGTITWSSGLGTGTTKEVGVGTYTATCVNSCGSSAVSNSITISNGPAPAAPVISSNKTTVCGTDKATLTATGCVGGTITWSGGGVGTTKEVGAGTYTATCTTSCGTSGNSNTITIGTSPSPVAPVISTNKTVVCGTDKATLTATGCADGTITWSSGLGTGTTKEVGVGTYTATCVNSCGSSAVSNSITISNGPAPAAPVISSNKTTVCGTDKSTLTATGCVGGTITWSGGGVGTTKEVGAGTYTATCTTSCGTSGNSNTITIGTSPSPVAPVISTNKTVICGVEKATLTATGCADGTITWSSGLGTGTTKEVGVGTYTATCVNSCGSSAVSNSITISNGPAPAAPVISSNKTTVCGTDKATLTATGCVGGTITWSGGGVGTTKEVGAGTYTATCTTSCGTSGNSNTITIGTSPSPVAPVISTNKTVICGVEKATLTATGCADGTITWSSGLGTGTTKEVGVGTYTATCVNSCGSSAVSNSITISNGPAPAAPVISSNKTTVCGTDKATLTATGCVGGTITWSGGGVGTTKEVGAGTYTATCTTSCGTSGNSNTITIGTSPSPVAPVISTNKTVVCGTDKATLTATGCADGTITWSSGLGTGTTKEVGVGTYTATCVNSCGSSAVSNSITISNGPAPAAPVISSNKTTVCGTDKSTLTATGCVGGTITWSGGGVGTTKEVGAGTYTATCTTSCGTSGNSNTITIGTSPSPVAPVISTNKTVICGVEKATLTATGCADGTITWSSGLGTGTTKEVGVGTYTATCVNSCGSSAVSNSITISNGPAPAAPVISSNKTTVCGTDKATLTATGCVGGTITWSGGGVGTTKEVGAGTYTATCTTSCGTSGNSNTITIGTSPSPVAPVISTNKTVVCGTDKATLTATGCADGTITWSSGLGTGTTKEVGVGTYTATCVNSCGSSAVSNSITISNGPAPAAPVISSNKTTVCGTDKSTLTATGCVGGTITWSGGGVGTTKEVGAGTYTATCTTSCGTSGNSNMITIGTSPSPVAPVISTNKTVVCGTDKATLTATGCADGTITWSSGLGTGTTKEVGVGTYTATCVNSCGSSAVSNSITISNGPAPAAPVISSNKTTVCGTDKATLTATGCVGGTITWSGGGVGTTKEVGAGTYTATCTTSCGTSGNSNTITIGTSPSPVAPVISTNKTVVCGTDKATLTATGCADGTITWSSGLGTGTTKEVGVGTYTATCVNSCGSSAVSNSITISNGPAPAAPVISSNKTTVCGTDKATLTATGCVGGTITWSGGGVGTTKEVGAGTYTATCTTSCGTSGNSNMITIGTSPSPVAPVISTNKAVICGVEKATLTATGCADGTITWSSGLGTGTTKEVGVGTYTATCVNSCGSSAVSNSITISNGPAPAAPVISSNKTTVCGTDKATLTATGCVGGTITWSSGLGTGTTKEVGVGTYTATCQTACGTSNLSNLIIITNSNSLFRIEGPTQPICQGSSITLTAVGCNSTVTWFNGMVGSSVTFLVTSSGAYGTYSATCGTGSSQTICDFKEGNITLISRGGSSGSGIITKYLLTSSSKIILQIKDSPTFTNVVSGSYNIVAVTYNSNISGLIEGQSLNNIVSSCKSVRELPISVCNSSVSNLCEVSTESIEVSILPAPVAPVISSNKTTVCGTDKATLTATGCVGGTITWSGGGVGTTKEVGAGTYTATCTTSCGTSGNSNTITIGTSPSPVAPVISTNKTVICGVEKATLTATGCADGTITWSSGLGTGTTKEVGVGTYTATCVNSCGSSAVSNSITISNGPAPAAPVISSNKTTVCGTDKATLTATGCVGGTITWSGGGVGTTKEVGAGTYTATCTTSCGTSGNSNTTTIGTSPSPVAPVISTNKTVVCGTDKATLTATGCADGTITWSSGLGTGTTKEVGVGTYTATCVNSCGSSAVSNSITISNGPAPAAPVISSNKTTVCGTDKATLTATGCVGGTITWSGGGVGTTKEVGAGTYTATCTTSCGTSGNSNTITIGTSPSPVAPVISTNKTVVCGTDKATLTATGCADGTITWSSGLGTGTTKEVGVGTYTATCVNSCGSSAVSNSITISNGPAPAAPVISSNKTTVCGTDKATFTATGCVGGTITWSGGGVGTTKEVGAGTYTATCTTSCGTSSNSNTITIGTSPSPVAPVISTNKTVVCGTDKATLTATGCADGTITWSSGLGTGTTKEVGAGTYTATCVNSCGSSAVSNSITISNGPAPVAPLISSTKTTVCGTDKATITATGCVGGTITWSGGGVGTTKEVGAGTYTATCTTSCGTSGNSNTITIGTSPAPVAPVISTNKTVICGVEKATLTATGCADGTITWSSGLGTGTTKEVGVGTYTATCVNSCGSSAVSNSITISNGLAPAAPVISSNKTTVCGTDKATLTATGCVGGTITWSGGGVGTTKEVGAGTYTATCTTSCGTSGNSNTITIGTSPSPVAPVISGNKTEICGNEEINLTATNCSGTVKWSNNATGASIKVTQAGDYAAVCQNSCGESPNSNIVKITIGGVPNAPLITTDKVTVCDTAKARLVAVGCNSTVEWSNGSTGNVIFVGVGAYTAKCKNSCGTSLASNFINIEIGVLPKAPVITSNKLTVCGTDKVILTASVCEGGTITWSMGGTGTWKEVGTGTYTATCTNACGTSGNSNVIIIQNGSAPVAPLLTSNKLTVCGTDKATLIAAGCESGTITWSAGGTGTTIQVHAGTYSATCTNACGTSGNSNVILIVEKVAEAPIITASKTQICSPEDITLKATGCLTGVLQWSNGKTGRQIIVKPQFSTIYSAVCIEEGSCQSSVSNYLNIRLIEIDKPIVACIKNIICEGEKVTISVENCIGEVKWSNGMVGDSINIVPSSNTEYTAVCTEGECVSEVSEPICITVGSPNQPFVTCAKNTICLGETTTLTAQGCLGNVIWSNGFLGSTLKVSSQEVGTFNYSAICKSISGNCQSLPSKTIKVIVGGIVRTPTVISEISNICPFESLDLNNSILGNPSSAGGSFEFHISNSPNSAIVTSPGLVTGGEYYLFERSKEGCYSIPAKVTAKIVKCGVNGIIPDSTHKVDIEVSKTANLTNALIGGFVYYKIQVKNNKNVKATNLVIRDIVPSGLQIDSISTNAKIENGVIFAKIDSLSKNDVTTITYKAKVTSTGKIVNKAEVLSVDQMDPFLSNNVSYFTINDDLFEREKVIGLSKHVGQILKLDSNKYEIPFTFNLSNMGTTNLNRIQLEDDLLATFGIDAILLDSTIQVVADSGLVVNPLFTGRIPNTSLLIDSLSNIPAGVSKSVRIKVKVKATNDQKEFFNSATVFVGLNKTITDISTDGTDADPDNNGNPNDNSIPTSFRLNNDTLTSAIATSLTIVDSSLVDDFTYRVKYMVLVKNIGNTILENVYLTDSLSKMYPANIDFKVSEKGIVSSQSNLTPNVVFDGIVDHRLTLMDSTKKLKVGEIDTVYFTVDIKYGNNYGPYFNSVKAFGSDDFGNTVTDISNSGTKIIAIKSDSTVFYIPIDTTELSKLVLVPGGFSPNGDNVNDEFKIEIKGSVEVENIIIVNRWGARVFEGDNLERKMELIGWNGKSNQGIRLGSSDDVPDGTYFYILKIKGVEKPLVDFITIIR